MRRQQEHAKAFQRQVEAEEEFLRSSQRQVERDAQVAARLAAGHDESAAFDAIQQAQRDAEMAARLQSEYDHRGRTARPTVKTTKKTVRVLVPATARPGDSLAVKTSSMGKFEITVPEWARPDSHFDCLITTTIEIVPLQRTRQTANRNAYQPPLPPDNLPPGWERGATPDGVPFYVDHNTRTTHWAPPSTPAPAPASSAPASSAPASSAPGEAALSRMTEEEMLAEAIARSLQDAPPAEAEVPEDDPPQDSDAHDVVDEVPAGSETDLLGLGDPSRDDGPQTPPPPPQGDHQQPQPPAI
ncbi:hypothetical protein CTAYLR_007163 [Chrysophaeum taylorii]|uniref:WW domain-containing protein n=1 Tax=Chrysophaeum taylorii TaxID=2483200 RepID=A0AAD7UKT6_9STRA|nr:hypothetical protein CTAYLR_007163 [Chrysophaeum taylorii]